MSSNDSVSLVLPDTPTTYVVDLDTSNGDQNVSIRTDPESRRKIVAHTSNGDVSVTYGPD